MQSGRKHPNIKSHINLIKEKIITANPKTYTSEDEIKFKSRRVPDIILWDGIQTVSIKIR